MTNKDASFSFRDRQDREPNLRRRQISISSIQLENNLGDPIFHELRDIQISRSADSLPQIVRNAVCEQFFLEVQGNTFQKSFFSDVVRKHAQSYICLIKNR